jgi:hypothetical protein
MAWQGLPDAAVEGVWSLFQARGLGTEGTEDNKERWKIGKIFAEMLPLSLERNGELGSSTEQKGTEETEKTALIYLRLLRPELPPKLASARRPYFEIKLPLPANGHAGSLTF